MDRSKKDTFICCLLLKLFVLCSELSLGVNQCMVNKKLKVAVPDAWAFHVNRSETGTVRIVGGIQKSLPTMLAKGMNVEMEFYSPKVGWGKTSKNGTGYGVVGLLYRGEVDLAFGSQYFSFPFSNLMSVSFYTNEVSFITAKPNFISEPWLFLKSFSYVVWSFILVSFILTAFILFWTSDKSKSLADYCFSTSAMLLQKGAEIQPSHRFLNRLSFGIFAVAAALIGLFLNSVLFSVMTSPNREPPINTMDKLLKAMEQNKIKMTIFKSGNSYVPGELTKHTNPSYRKVGKLVKEHNRKYNISYPNAGYTKEAFNDGYGIFANIGSYFDWGVKEKVVVSEDIIFRAVNVVSVKQDFRCLEKLNLELLHMCESGVIDVIISHYFETYLRSSSSKIKKDFSEVEQVVKPLTLKDLKGCFLFWLIGMTLATIVFIFELVSKKISGAKSFFVV